MCRSMRAFIGMNGHFARLNLLMRANAPGRRWMQSLRWVRSLKLARALATGQHCYSTVVRHLDLRILWHLIPSNHWEYDHATQAWTLSRLTLHRLCSRLWALHEEIASLTTSTRR